MESSCLGFSSSQSANTNLESPKTVNSNNVAQNRQRLSKMLQLHGYSACREALILLEDHFTSSAKYESMEDFISKLNRIITFHTEANSSIIDPDLAYVAIKKLCQAAKNQLSLSADDGNNLINNDNNQIECDNPTASDVDQQPTTIESDESPSQVQVPKHLNIRVKSVQCDQIELNVTNPLSRDASGTGGSVLGIRQANEFNIHYNFLYKRLNTLPIFQGDFQLTKLADLTASSQPNIRCICFGLLIKDIFKIDGYLLIDSTGRVPLKITPDTTFRNRLAYSSCIVLVEGVYVNPDDVLFAANVGLPPILLDPLEDKSLACVDEKLIIILRELFLDDEDVVKSLDMLFTGYNSMEEPPAMFILIGDFTRNYCEPRQLRKHMRNLIKILKSCDNLKDCHFVFIPGPKDTTQLGGEQDDFTIKKLLNIMPKCQLTPDHIPLNLLDDATTNFDNFHLATNPAHIYLGERQISVVAHSYLKELRKNLLHDLSDHREELFETAKQIILSNAHLSAGITKTYHSSMNLWHKPDLLILADTEATGNRYDYSSSRHNDTSFATIPSFSCQSNQFKVYYLKTGDIEDSQVSNNVSRESEVVQVDDDGKENSDNEEKEDESRESLQQQQQGAREIRVHMIDGEEEFDED